LTASSRVHRRRRRRVVLVFGESQNDTKAIAELIIALCPELAASVKAILRPPLLIKDIRPDRIPDRVAIITGLIRAEAVSADVICVFAHEDTDAVAPSDERLSQRIEAAFSSVGVHLHAVTPASEIEAWWFLFPQALRAYRPSWERLRGYAGRDVGRIVDAKEELRRALRPRNSATTSRDYRESDSPGIAAKVRELGIVSRPDARCGSFERFTGQVASCCTAFTDA
jgi:hypothetical protein